MPGLASSGLLGKFLGGGTQQAPVKVGQGVVARPGGGLPNPPRFEQAYANRKTLVGTDVITVNSGNPTNLPSTQFTTVGTYTVPVQTCLRFGYGQIGNGYEWGVGNLYMDANIPAGTDIDGIMRFFASNSQGTFSSFFLEQTTGRMRQSTPSERLRNPEQDPPIYENSGLRMDFKPNTATTTALTTLSGTATVAELDVTQYL